VSEATAPVALLAPAKVNLYLHVTGRRDDGYHLLDSLVAFADVGDVVTVTPSERWRFAVDGPFAAAVPGGEDNLVMRAARALAAAAGTDRCAAIGLDKRLPVAAGLGGGSADAAAALRALIRLWGLAVDDDDLTRLALPLGADLPACLAGRPVFVGGIGDRLAPAPPLPPVWLVLANPGRPLATAAVYGRRHGAFSRDARFTEAPSSAAALAKVVGERHNELTAAATALEPAVGEVVDRLSALEGALLARMSGSGASCFALFADGAAAASAAAGLARERPDWWVASARLLS
jgi:4-diphosphocytidyl-2-C-methyl-D-erythritol kinase